MSRLAHGNFWLDRSVFITGHKGFKGAWLTRIVSRFGAQTTGFGRDNRDRLVYKEVAFDKHVNIDADINDTEKLRSALLDAKPSVLFHLAAQPLVLDSYEDPLQTFQSNVMGTASVLQAARDIPSIAAIVIVTSDKVYHNHEWAWPYRETDRLGGTDPYSASKAAAEILTQSMVKSFYENQGFASVVTVRAGNVIGGGDWANCRLLPDGARAFEKGNIFAIRNPYSTRPWQHVLEPLCGYLMLAEAMVKDGAEFGGSWNFGPKQEDAISVGDVADAFVFAWGDGVTWGLAQKNLMPQPKEAKFLAVDTAKARIKLGWQPRWNVGEAIHRTAVWYRDYLKSPALATTLMDQDIDSYFNASREASMPK